MPHDDEGVNRPPDGDRFTLDWRLVVETEDPGTLERALAPESDGHHELDVEDGRLVARGQGDPGATLHTVDDLLACLTGALDVLGEGSDR